jgi:hypothetical protein
MDPPPERSRFSIQAGAARRGIFPEKLIWTTISNSGPVARPLGLPFATGFGMNIADGWVFGQ